MSCQGVKVGDIIISNRKADIYYLITRNRWIGIVTKINKSSDTFSAKKYSDEKEEFDGLMFECFDLYPLTPAQELARELGFKVEGIL